MAILAWATIMAALSPVTLTVRAQAVSLSNQDKTTWFRYFPRREVTSVELDEIFNTDLRLVADRRPWNGVGRRLHLSVPALRNLIMEPVESEFVIDEKEMNILNSRMNGNDDEIMKVLKVRIEDRVPTLVGANNRRIELDAISAWTAGTVTPRNPIDGKTTAAISYGFDSARYTTAGTAWNDVSLNAYNEFIAWLVAGQDLIGGIEGAVMRRATFNAILADAPTNPAGVRVDTIAELTQRVSDKIASPFRFEINETSYDLYNDGGTATTSTKVWPAQKIAAIPAGGVVGETCFAPVVRAGELSKAEPAAEIVDTDQSVYYLKRNDGKELAIQCQVNPLTVPNEQLVWVVNCGV